MKLKQAAESGDIDVRWLIDCVKRWPVEWSPQTSVDCRDFVQNTQVGQVLVTRLTEQMSEGLIQAMECVATGREDEAIQYLLIATHKREALISLVDTMAESLEAYND